MYPPARGWAVDAVPLQLKSINLSQVKADKGKTGAWQAIFVSPSRGKSKNFTYSVIEAEGNLHQGVFSGLEEDFTAGSWAPPRCGMSCPLQPLVSPSDPVPSRIC